ncbi:hypothetical protein [Planctopirus hydrillae]|uniref:hypothetical protein n=1 Tax=Planctopirus hydrillae TaxID=1841610 RepID=UPI0013F4C1C5|nr:hypothetical protein [Planctopirus hydrillae]
MVQELEEKLLVLAQRIEKLTATYVKIFVLKSSACISLQINRFPVYMENAHH